jgi:hypothetical protein
MPQFGRFHQLRKFLEVDRTVAWAGMKDIPKVSELLPGDPA